jgi:hypothetical protein
LEKEVSELYEVIQNNEQEV